MKAPKRKPFIISRQPYRKAPSSSEAKVNLKHIEQSNSRAVAVVEKKDTQIEWQNQVLATQTVFKNCYNLFKVSPSLLPELLKKYAEDNLKYRDEEFTQQADNFLLRIASGKKVPKELRAKYPIYHILISICKIFMLNEYEIVVLGCALDHCGWKIEETVYLEEADYLKEFPGNLGNDIDIECKRLIIYLLVITFSLKQYINEKGEVDKIHAYCESICANFQAIFNRWTRVSFYHKFNYSPLEINRKFRSLCQRDNVDLFGSLQDYNMVVDTIMNLTGSYKSKGNKPNALAPPQTFMIQAPIFQTFQLPPVPETKPIFADLPTLTFERGASRTKNVELMNFENLELPPEFDGVSRQSSTSNIFGDENGKKKIKFNNSTSNFTSLLRENSILKDFSFSLNNNLSNNINVEDYFLMNTPLPGLSKRSSNVSQVIPEEQPSLFRFHSNMSSW